MDEKYSKALKALGIGHIIGAVFLVAVDTLAVSVTGARLKNPIAQLGIVQNFGITLLHYTPIAGIVGILCYSLKDKIDYPYLVSGLGISLALTPLNLGLYIFDQGILLTLISLATQLYPLTTGLVAEILDKN